MKPPKPPKQLEPLLSLLPPLPAMPKPSLKFLPLLAIGGIVSVFLLLVVIYLVWSWWSRPPFAVFGYGAPPDQPIAFTHKTHAGALGIDCQFCHRNVTDSKSVGEAMIPSVEQCTFCHKIVGTSATSQADPEKKAEIAKVMAAFNNNEPINWNRVHRLPDHVQFFHQPHIQAGLPCSTCHGDVASMTTMRQVRTLKMRDCVDCHRNNGAPTDCVTCHY